MTVRTKAAALEDLRQALSELFAAQRRLRGRDAANKDGLTHAQAHLLGVLFEKGGELAASRLAACAALTPTTVTQMVDPLEKHGLVERVRSAEDRRVVFIRLTDRGRDEVMRKRAAFAERWQELLADAEPAELDQAAGVLRKVAGLLDGI